MTTLADDNTPYKLLVEQSSAPSSPAAGKQVVYIRTSDHHVVRKDSGGTIVDIEAGGSVVDDTAYDATSWNGDTTHAPSKNAVRDKIETLGAGSSVLVKRVISEVATSATGTTIMPLDDTIPQNTEGNEYMTVTITPANSSNILYIEVVFFAVYSIAAWMSVALFQDSTAGALAAMTGYSAQAGGGAPIVFRHKMVAGTTSATTFKVRAGGHSAGTTTFNGNAGARIFGGVIASSITVSELTP